MPRLLRPAVGTTLSSPRMSAQVGRCLVLSAARASKLFLQVQSHPRRCRVEIGYILATSGRTVRCFRRSASAKEKPRNSRRGLAAVRAEGMGFEPTTPCGAPDFESCLGMRRERPGSSKLATCSRLERRKIPRLSTKFAAVRLIGYRLATPASAHGPDIHVSHEPPSANK
jgi:hypothetical protein